MRLYAHAYIVNVVVILKGPYASRHKLLIKRLLVGSVCLFAAHRQLSDFRYNSNCVVIMSFFPIICKFKSKKKKKKHLSAFQLIIKII